MYSFHFYFIVSDAEPCTVIHDGCTYDYFIIQDTTTGIYNIAVDPGISTTVIFNFVIFSHIECTGGGGGNNIALGLLLGLAIGIPILIIIIGLIVLAIIKLLFVIKVCVINCVILTVKIEL